MSKVIAFLTGLLLAAASALQPKTNPAAELPTTEPTITAVATATSNGCEAPPPWSDREIAERCWVHYPPPFGRVIVRHCETGLSDLGDIICYGYWLIPAAVYPLLTPSPIPPPTETPIPYP